MTAFHFPVRRKAAIQQSKGAIRVADIGEEEPIGSEIQGIAIGSKEEWRFALAVTKLNMTFDYQVPIRGGRRLRGGQVVDFVVYNPFPQPCQVFGEYWHEQEINAEERLLLAQIEQIYKRPCLIAWARELQTQAMAIETSRRLLA